MRKALPFFILVLILAAITNANTQEILIKTGFITGNEYLRLPDVNKLHYVMGVVDGIFLAPFFGAPKDKMDWIEKFLVNMTDSQVTAIINKYLQENPQRWHESMNVIIYSAFREACLK